ncbi:MAG: hypothetical protein GY866_24530 [Proteobacteria bacterium]|nr:hypothetical protein [Pseudomonadota bacterium]
MKIPIYAMMKRTAAWFCFCAIFIMFPYFLGAQEQVAVEKCMLELKNMPDLFIIGVIPDTCLVQGIELRYSQGNTLDWQIRVVDFVEYEMTEIGSARAEMTTRLFPLTVFTKPKPWWIFTFEALIDFNPLGYYYGDLEISGTTERGFFNYFYDYTDPYYDADSAFVSSDNRMKYDLTMQRLGLGLLIRTDYPMFQIGVGIGYSYQNLIPNLYHGDYRYFNSQSTSFIPVVYGSLAFWQSGTYTVLKIEQFLDVEASEIPIAGSENGKIGFQSSSTNIHLFNMRFVF